MVVAATFSNFIEIHNIQTCFGVSCKLIVWFLLNQIFDPGISVLWYIKHINPTSLKDIPISQVILRICHRLCSLQALRIWLPYRRHALGRTSCKRQDPPTVTSEGLFWLGFFEPKNVTSFKRWLASWVGCRYKVCENGRWQWWQQLFRTFRCLQVVQFVVLCLFENVETTCFAEKKASPPGWWGAWVLPWNCCKCWATGCGGGGPTLPIFIQNHHALSRYFHKQLCEPSF